MRSKNDPLWIEKFQKMMAPQVKSMRKYSLVVDCGIPYEEKLTKKQLMKELKKLEKKAAEEPSCDVWVYKGEKDVTESVFKTYRKKKRRR